VQLRARLDERRAHPTCGEAPGRFSRALSLLGIVSTVVYAQGSCNWSCGQIAGCGGQPQYESCYFIGCNGGTFTNGYTEADPGTNQGDYSTYTQCTSSCSNACYAEVCYDCE
jgi:hypothetical protein